MTIDELLPPEVVHEPQPAVETVTLDDGEVIEALSSTTARQVIIALQNSQAPASAIAEEVNESIQTVLYHLEQLERIGLVTPVATTYSAKGKEMDIYGLTTDSFILKLEADLS